MLFPEDVPLLQAWIVKRIENTSNADSDVPAEFVIALLKHGGDQAAIRQLCERDLSDFLIEDTNAFVDDVFRAIKHRSYLPGAPPPPTGLEAQSVDDARAAAPGNTGSLKRALDDAAESNHASGGPRSHKQPRRGNGWQDSRDGKHPGFPAANLPPLPPALPQYDANNSLEVTIQMQAMGIPFPAMPAPKPSFGGQVQRNLPRRRGRCRDFDMKGYCSRGSTCLYDHGNESIYIPAAPSAGLEYDPRNAVMHITTLLNQANSFSFHPDPNRGRRGNRTRGNGGRGGRKGGARAPFLADGPVHDRSKSTIVVENIPEESFSEDQVRGFFSQFGDIIKVSMQPYKHLAVVRYDKWAAANAAYRSPKVIFDNRFIKVFWCKDEEGARHLSAPLDGNNGTKSAMNDAGLDAGKQEPEADLEGFHRKQEEAQKQHRERESKRVELERQRQELQKQQQELLAKHQAETERLRARLTEKNGDDASPGSSGTDMLRAQLAVLEHEAKILGIDPNAADEGGVHVPRGVFRDRRGYRGRGGFTPRPRGSSARGPGARHTAYSHYLLDNRPKTVAVSGVDFTAAEKDEMLRHFLLNLGEFQSVETSPSVTHVSFQDRRTAERFYHSLHGKELPGVDGKLDVSWVNAPMPRVPTAKPTDDSAAAFSDDEMAGADDAPEASKEELTPRRQVDMDYEVGDDGAWGKGIQ